MATEERPVLEDLAELINAALWVNGDAMPRRFGVSNMTFKTA